MPDRLPLVSFAWFANSCVGYFHRERSKTVPAPNGSGWRILCDNLTGAEPMN